MQIKIIGNRGWRVELVIFNDHFKLWSYSFRTPFPKIHSGSFYWKKDIFFFFFFTHSSFPSSLSTTVSSSSAPFVKTHATSLHHTPRQRAAHFYFRDAPREYYTYLEFVTKKKERKRKEMKYKWETFLVTRSYIYIRDVHLSGLVDSAGKKKLYVGLSCGK